MRITCPNCNAKYEIGEDVVPTEGRDVQCSNCGTTWFQEGRGRESVTSEPGSVRRPSRPLRKGEGTRPASARPGRPTPDPSTLDILREEREREERLRDSDMDAPRRPLSDETVPDAEVVSDGTDDERANAARERAKLGTAAERVRSRRAVATGDVPTPEEEDDNIADVIAATMRDARPSDASEAPVTDAPAAAAAVASAAGRSARRDMLPDIEEINSSLRPDERAIEAGMEEAETVEEEVPDRQKVNGFRLGFLVVFLLIVIMVLIYVYSNQISAAVPALDGAMNGYVDWVDAQRGALARGVESLTDKIAPASTNTP